MRINAEILDLRAFLAVLDLRNFHRAADTLNISQPALSRRLKALEDMLGTPLLERSTRRVTPTRAGIEVEPIIRRVLQELEDCAFVVGEAGGRHQGMLTISSVPTAAAAFVPRVVNAFIGRYPEISFRILDLTARDALQAVIGGEADLGVNFLGPSRPEIKFTPLIDDPFVLVCRRDHEFARLPTIRWRDLLGQRLIVSHKSGNRELIDRALANSDLALNWAVEVGHLASSFGLVAVGVGMSIVPKLSLAPETNPALAAVPLREPELNRTIGLVERRVGKMSMAAQRFKELLLTEFTDLNGERV